MWVALLNKIDLKSLTVPKISSKQLKENISHLKN